MHLAFYAPMKSPDHPNPSGDRTIARAILSAFSNMGATTTIASQLRTRDGSGDAELQSSLFEQASLEVTRLLDLSKSEAWDAWVTYHNYYKAPDLIGPAVTKALGIPYVLIEATRARKRLTGLWADFAHAAEAATDAADIVFYFSTRDAKALERDAPSGQKLLHLRPFLDQSNLPSRVAKGHSILVVGMMRPGDKMASYQIIADTLAQLDFDRWQLKVAGDGTARPDIEHMFKPFGDRIQFLGKLEKAELFDAYIDAGVLFWPGVNEALGMIYIEAQAAGLPVVAQDRPGMRDVLAPGSYPDPSDGVSPLSIRLSTLLSDPDVRREASSAARQFIANYHLLPRATETLKKGLRSVGVQS